MTKIGSMSRSILEGMLETGLIAGAGAGAGALMAGEGNRASGAQHGAMIGGAAGGMINLAKFAPKMIGRFTAKGKKNTRVEDLISSVSKDLDRVGAEWGEDAASAMIRIP